MRRPLNRKLARVQDNLKQIFQRLGLRALFILDAELQKGNACRRECLLLSIFNYEVNFTLLLFVPVEIVPVQLHVHIKDISREIVDEVNKGVQTNLIQAILSKGESMLVLHSLSINLTAPKFKLIQQVIQSAVTELV